MNHGSAGRPPSAVSPGSVLLGNVWQVALGSQGLRKSLFVIGAPPS